VCLFGCSGKNRCGILQIYPWPPGCREPSEKAVAARAAAAPALWPSLKNQRISKSWGASRYLVADGALDECIRQFMSKPESQHHLYEIHTTPQAELITAVLSAEHIVELARLRDFL